MKELLHGKNLEDLPQEHQDNLSVLLERINKVRALWGKPITVTSGYRSMSDHLRIYREIAEKKGIPFDESKVPLHSKHLYGQAADLYDPDGSLLEFCKADDDKVIVDAELWGEDDPEVPRVHLQIIPPPSQHRWFKP